MPSIKSEARALLCLAVLFPVIAQATDSPLPQAPGDETKPALVRAPAATATEPAPNPQAEPLAGMGPSIAPDTLEQYRGGTAVNSMSSEAISNGLLQNATATRVASGNNSIADGAFSHSMGLPIVIQNSGANVLIQNSTIVNVQFR